MRSDTFSLSHAHSTAMTRCDSTATSPLAAAAAHSPQRLKREEQAFTSTSSAREQGWRSCGRKHPKRPMHSTFFEILRNDLSHLTFQSIQNVRCVSWCHWGTPWRPGLVPSIFLQCRTALQQQKLLNTHHYEPPPAVTGLEFYKPFSSYNDQKKIMFFNFFCETNSK